MGFFNIFLSTNIFQNPSQQHHSKVSDNYQGDSTQPLSTLKNIFLRHAKRSNSLCLLQQ